jgi:hypothetical protein
MQRRAVVTWTTAAAIVAGAVTIAQLATTEKWVVESSAYSRGADGETFSVVCVPAADLALPHSERRTWREIKTDRETSYQAEQGDPCPHGQIIGSP